MVTRNLFLFMFREFHFLIFLLVVELETVLSADKEFEACLPYNCGRGPNITYPFWINGKQNSSCGFPGFELFCKNREPTLNMSGDEYVIREIFHGNQSFFMTKLGEYEICSPLTYRLKFARLPFTYVHSSVNLFIFFNCSASFPDEYSRYSFGCANDSLRRQSLALFSDDPIMESVRQSGECETSVVTPVVYIGNGSLNTVTQREYIEEFLNEGFYLKWNATACEECASTGGRCGFNYTMYKFMCFCTDRPHHRWCRNATEVLATKPEEGKTKRKVAIGVGTGVGGILLTCILFILYQRRKRNKLNSSSALISRSFSVDPSSKQDLEQGSIYFQTPIFTYKELDEATNHFDTNKELGDGGFGTVYHGKLRDGRVVAVKRLFEHNYKRVEQFMNEIVILSRLRHQNLVSLYGCTNRHSRELLLVYEYVPNGTVADHLHGNRAENGLLTWPIRMSIAIESADALAYLHASDVVHRDVKTNNILLDKDFHVKVADFGLSRLFPLDVTHVSTAPQGTPGYVDPEYYQCYQLNEKSDVYSFGVVLIELISSKPAVDIGRHRHEINLANMAINRIHNRELHDLVDPTLGFDSDYSTRNMITLVAELAFRCLQQEKEMRPFMAEVLETLKGIENEKYKKKKADELDIPADECPLKNSQPLSPDSVTDKWVSKASTPNTSG